MENEYEQIGIPSEISNPIKTKCSLFYAVVALRKRYYHNDKNIMDIVSLDENKLQIKLKDINLGDYPSEWMGFTVEKVEFFD